MRRLRIVVTAGTSGPILALASLGPASCGSRSSEDGPNVVTLVREVAEGGALELADVAADEVRRYPPFVPDPTCPNTQRTFELDVPPAGAPVEAGTLCSVVVPPVASSNAARVSLENLSLSARTADGFVSVDPALLPLLVAPPDVRVANRGTSAESDMSITNLTPAPGGFRFDAAWDAPFQAPKGHPVTLITAMQIRCADGGTQHVEGRTDLTLCIEGDTFGWASSGELCTVCAVIAEMAPTPIASDCRGDDLPLGRPIALGVRELARVGHAVVLLAENDGGGAAHYEWRVSGGTLEPLAADVVLWTPPTDAPLSFGQIAVWTDGGAAVENFLWRSA